MINYGNRIDFDNIIKNTDGEKLRKIFIYFKILHLYKKESIEYHEIENAIETYSILKIKINDVLQLFKLFSDFQQEEKKKYNIEINLFKIVEKEMNIVVTEYKNNYLQNKLCEYGESFNNYIYCLEDILYDEEETQIYPHLMNKDFEEDNKYFSNEIIFLSERRKIREEILKIYFSKIENEIKALREEYIILNEEKNNMNNNNDNEQRIQDLIEEINSINYEKEKKGNQIKDLNKIIAQNEIVKQNLIEEIYKSQNEIKKLNVKYSLLEKQNIKLKENYDNTIDEIINKIKKENEEQNDREKLLNNEKSLDFSISTNISDEKIKKFKGLSSDQIFNYIIQKDNENNNLMNKINELKYTVKEMTELLNNNENDLKKFKDNNYILVIENDKLKNELDDLKRENETYKLFRPSNRNSKIENTEKSSFLLSSIMNNENNSNNDSSILNKHIFIGKEIPKNKNDGSFNNNTNNNYQICKNENLNIICEFKKSFHNSSLQLEESRDNNITINSLYSNNNQIENKNINNTLYIEKSSFADIKILSQSQISFLTYSNSNHNNLNLSSIDYNSNYDNIFIKHSKKIIEFLKKNNTNNLNDIFIDDVYLVKNKGKMKRLYLIITNENIHITDLNSNSISINSNNLTKVIISSKNLNLIIFKFNKEDDIILQVMRRKKLIYFLKQFQNNIEYIESNRFILNDDKNKNQKKKQILDIELISYFPYYENTIFFGYLLLYEEILKIGKYTEKFVVLSDLGLLIFDSPLSNLNKIINVTKCEIKKTSSQKYNKSYGFEIYSNNNSHVFFTKTQSCLDIWISSIWNIAKKYYDELKLLKIKKE